MKNLIILFLLMFSLNLAAQKAPDVQFSGNKLLVLLAKKEAMKSMGKLSSSEIVRVGCDQGGMLF